MVPKPRRAVVHARKIRRPIFVQKDLFPKPAFNRVFRAEAEGQSLIIAILYAEAARDLAPLSAAQSG
jgi:hypothetical protein